MLRIEARCLGILMLAASACYESQAPADETETTHGAAGTDTTPPSTTVAGTGEGTGAGGGSWGTSTQTSTGATSGEASTSSSTHSSGSGSGTDTGGSELTTGGTAQLELLWQQPFDAGRHELAYEIQHDGQGGLLVAGTSYLPADNPAHDSLFHPVLQKYTPLGVRVWHFEGAETKHATFGCMAADGGGGAYVVFRGNNTARILHVGYDGKLSDEALFEPENDCKRVRACRVDSDDRFRLIWQTGDELNLTYTWFDAGLNRVADQTVALSSTHSRGDWFHTQLTTSGDVWLAASIGRPGDLAVARVNLDGTVAWERTYDNGFDERPSALWVDESGRATLVVRSEDIVPGSDSQYVIQYSPEGGVEWLHDGLDPAEDPRLEDFHHWNMLLTGDGNGGIIALSQVQDAPGSHDLPEVAGRTFRGFDEDWQEAWSHFGEWQPMLPFERSEHMIAGPQGTIYLVNTMRGSDADMLIEAFGPAM